MTEPREDFATRRAQLSEQIARQRLELGAAWRELERPIHYVENGMRAFGFLRRNPWIFAAFPAIFSMASFFFKWRKNKSAPPQELDSKPRKGFFKTWFGHATNAFHLYRRVKPFISREQL